MKKLLAIKRLLIFPALLLLSGCLFNGPDTPPIEISKNWDKGSSENISVVDAAALEGWWKSYNDPTLTTLVELALKDSPDREIAKARIAEARGLRRSARGALFPQIGASGSVGREDTGSSSASYPDNFYDAGFDASFELDIFGRNRNNFSAADAQLLALQEQYNDVSVTLIADVIRGYIDFRAAQNQTRIAQKNLVSQEKTLTLVQNLYDLGEAPKLDVERASSVVNTTRASLPEFQRQTDNARLGLSVLTGSLPEALKPILRSGGNIPGADVRPVLLAPADILTQRPDIKAATANLEAQSDLRNAAIADLFPTFSLSGFFSITDSALLSSVTPWNVAAGAAVSLLDFGRIEGQIEAANAREKIAYEQYRKIVLQAVTEVETALSDYAHINQQRLSLRQAYLNAAKALELSNILYKEGEISFLEVLDAQRTVNSAESSFITAKAAQAESLTRLFKSLGQF